MRDKERNGMEKFKVYSSHKNYTTIYHPDRKDIIDKIEELVDEVNRLNDKINKLEGIINESKIN